MPDNILELFCDIDDFCQLFLPDWERQLLANGERKRKRPHRLTLSEIMTLRIVPPITLPEFQSILLAPG